MNFVPRMNENMEFPDLSGDDIEWLQTEFVKSVLGRVEESKADKRIPKEDQGKVCFARVSSYCSELRLNHCFLKVVFFQKKKICLKTDRMGGLNFFT